MTSLVDILESELETIDGTHIHPSVKARNATPEFVAILDAWGGDEYRLFEEIQKIAVIVIGLGDPGSTSALEGHAPLASPDNVFIFAGWLIILTSEAWETFKSQSSAAPMTRLRLNTARLSK